MALYRGGANLNAPIVRVVIAQETMRRYLEYPTLLRTFLSTTSIWIATFTDNWLYAPHGAGTLYLRKKRIKDLWPMMSADESLDNNI